DLAAGQVGRHRWQTIVSTFGPAVFDRHVLALDITGLAQSLKECTHKVRVQVGRFAVEESDDLHRRLLRARRERPCSRRAAEQCDEVAPFHLRGHSMTSSARASSLSGIWRPSALAVLRLITNANLMDCITGRSAGCSPLRIRPA